MGFKDWWKSISSWLKGGIITVSIFIISIIILVILSNLNSNINPGLPMKEASGLGTIIIVTLIFYAVICFGIGSLIGLIIGKIKSKK